MGLGDITGNLNIPALSALLLGLITAISPCPLATNIAALGYVSRRATERRYAVITGALYTLGRMFSYSVIGVIIIVAGLEIPGVASFLQDFGEQALGPILIVVGAIMLTANRISFGRGGGRLSALGAKVADWGMIGGFLLGTLFAFAFCPYSAALFFGVLIPLALKSAGGVALPAVYAIGQLAQRDNPRRESHSSSGFHHLYRGGNLSCRALDTGLNKEGSRGETHEEQEINKEGGESSW
jgi:cytochrome c biogenesis protein CcdA